MTIENFKLKIVGRFLSFFVSPLCVLCASWVQNLPAQTNEARLRINQVRVGFAANVPAEPHRFKLGLWTPIAVELQAGPEKVAAAELAVETADSDNAGTIFSVAIESLKANEKRTVLAYAKPGNREGHFAISIRDRNKVLLASTSISQPPMDLRESLYLTVGAKLPDLQEALLALKRVRPDAADEKDKKNSWPRQAAHINDADLLPHLALGYDAVDLMIFTTGNEPMNRRLFHEDAAPWRAVGSWVRQGGRLVVSVSPGQDGQASFPPLAIAASFGVGNLPRLLKVEEWAGITDKPFPALGEKPVPVSRLQADKGPRLDWRVLAEAPDGQPLMAQMPYGRGQVTLLAFDLDREPFASWEGRVPFLKALVSRLEPRIPQVLGSQDEGSRAGQPAARDLATQLQISLDQFDVPAIRFGWVALLILGYILLVGPVDYFLLKKVLKRLQFTWVTFPLVVLAVSLLAYYMAYEVKGEELKINQVDLVDFDLRTDLDAKLRPDRAHAYGNTWFTLLSPEIKSYTIGLQPNLVAGWLGEKEKDPASAEVVSWFGRPEYDGPAAMGRPRLQTFAQKPYHYLPNARGLDHVPIPIWTSKSFMASWETPLPGLPFTVDLVYHHEKELVLSGTIQSYLTVDLHDLWIFFGSRCYPLEGPLKGSAARFQGDNGELVVGGEIRKIAMDQRSLIHGWPQRRDEGADSPIFRKSPFDPTTIVKEILFHELVDTAHLRNHSLRRLDLSWRLQEQQRPRQNLVREAILFGRIPTASGPAEQLAVSKDRPLPSLLWLNWLNNVAQSGQGRPPIPGTMVQDTFVRVLLPVRAALE